MLTQAQFNKVVRHLMTQRKPANSFDEFDNADGCLYRSPKGLKCAIGALIPNSKYKPGFENRSICAIDSRDIRDAASIGHDEDSRRQAEMLQWIHDDEDPADWKEKLIEFAHEYELDDSVVRSFKKIPRR